MQKMKKLLSKLYTDTHTQTVKKLNSIFKKYIIPDDDQRYGRKAFLVEYMGTIPLPSRFPTLEKITRILINVIKK